MTDFSMLDKDYPERVHPTETHLDEIRERMDRWRKSLEQPTDDGRRQVAINLLNNWRFNENTRFQDLRAEVEADHLLEEILQLMGVDL